MEKLARFQGMLLHFDADYSRRRILQELGVALHFTSAKILRCRRVQLIVPDEGTCAQELVREVHIGVHQTLYCIYAAKML